MQYFRAAFVEKRRWLSAPDYAAIVSLCQFLPGPASSQTGMLIGLARAGWRGALAAWAGFTLPSALAMLAVAHFASRFEASPIARHILHGLQLAAVAVVAQAVLAMARGLCPDLARRVIALLAVALLLLDHGASGQLLVLLLGGVAGFCLPRSDPPAPVAGLGAAVPPAAAKLCLGGVALLLLLCLPRWGHGDFALFAAFYRAGALVFGGGHVVLPLLQNAVVAPGWVRPGPFLAGYGAAQAMPGPLFTVAAYLGAVANAGSGGVAGGVIALVAIFLPGLLLAAGLLPYWHALRQRPALAGALAGVNAAVVGLLGYAWLSLVALGPIQDGADIAIIGLALLGLTLGRAPPILIVALCAAAGFL